MTRALKTCPFCGNAAAWCDEHHKDEPHECHHIVCTACDAQFDMSGIHNPETLDELKDYCAKSFNNRAEQARQPQVPEAYRKLEAWARKLPTIVLKNGELPYATELNELDDILREIGRSEQASLPEALQLAKDALEYYAHMFAGIEIRDGGDKAAEALVAIKAAEQANQPRVIEDLSHTIGFNDGLDD